jgi:hypothetical protein
MLVDCLQELFNILLHKQNYTYWINDLWRNLTAIKRNFKFFRMWNNFLYYLFQKVWNRFKIMVFWDVTLCALVLGTNTSEESTASIFRIPWSSFLRDAGTHPPNYCHIPEDPLHRKLWTIVFGGRGVGVLKEFNILLIRLNIRLSLRYSIMLSF